MKKNRGKIFFGLVFFTIIIVGYIFDFNKILTFDTIKATYQDIQILINKNYILYYSAFFILYIVVTAFALPISLIKTLLAGALFGFWPGLVLVSFGSSIGSPFCCLFLMYLL